MYCKPETLKLAFEKGFRQCSCANGGYPDCICDKKPYRDTRLDDIQRWLREQHTYHIEVMLEDDTPYTSYYYRVMKLGKYFTQSHHGLISPIYDSVLEAAVLETLSELI